METAFITLLNRSIAAGWTVLTVVLLRFFLKKSPKWIRILLWAVVGIRLTVPFSIQSPVSLVPSAQLVDPTVLYVNTPDIDSGIAAVNSLVNPVLANHFSATPTASINPMQVVMISASVVWLLGMGLILLHGAISYGLLRYRISTAVRVRENIWQSEQIVSPFVLGIISPRIYLPFSLGEEDMPYVVAHEKAHICRRDLLVKLVAWFLLAIYWFQPFLWLAYALLCRDIELACDESVTKNLGMDSRKSYSQALLRCSAPRTFMSACPLSFGEGNVKRRIQNILDYKKPKFWVVAVALVICTVAALCFLTDPVEDVQAVNLSGEELDEKLDLSINHAILEHHKSDQFACESHVTLATLSDDRQNKGFSGTRQVVEVYAMVLYKEFKFVDGCPYDVGGSQNPTVLTFQKGKDGEYLLTDYWEPRDRAYYADIKKRFEKLPPQTMEQAMDRQRFAVEQAQNCYAQAVAYGGVDTNAVIDQLITEIMSSPNASSNPRDYINAHPIAYRNLIFYGDDTLRYVFVNFLKGGQTGLKGQIMRRLMDDLIGNETLLETAENGQEYFDQWKASAERMNTEHGAQYMMKHRPKAFLLLQMLNQA